MLGVKKDMKLSITDNRGVIKKIFCERTTFPVWMIILTIYDIQRSFSARILLQFTCLDLSLYQAVSIKYIPLAT